MTAARRDRNSATAGVEGWDAYAPFYDWENARTVGRRDVPFWRSLAAAENGPVLELGCGTGRITIPAARAGAHVVGVDRSAAMLERARSRVKRLKGAGSAALVRGDIRELPFRRAGQGFSLVMAPYGILQSLTREKDLKETLASVHRVLRRGGTLRDRPGTGSSEVVRIQPPGKPSRSARQDTRDAGRIRAPGPQAAADDLRS